MSIKKQKIFNIISATIILGLIIIYSSRFIYFKYYEGKAIEKITDLSTKLIKQNNLLKEGDTYYFMGKQETNYLLYSNMLFQIVSVTPKDLTLILVEPAKYLYYDNEYEKSNINKYLNQEFYKRLDKTLMKKIEICINDIVDKKDPCVKKYSSNVGLLSLYMYDKIGGADSYLNNGYSSYLSNGINNHYYIDENGTINISKIGYYGLKPMITIKNAFIISGIGTYSNPYKIKGEVNEKN